MSMLFDRIESRCKELGITPTYMCNQTGIRKSLVTDLKSERIKSINSDTLVVIAEYLKVSCDYLLLGHDNSGFTSEERALIHAYRLAPFEDKENVAFMLRKYGAVAPSEAIEKRDVV